jgi:hypothetical protein
VFKALTAALLLAVVGAAAVPMTDPAILYSPYNWDVTDVGAKTINPGAYWKVVFTATTGAQLNASCNPSVRIPSQFWTRVDGGPLVQHICKDAVQLFNVSFGPPFSATNNHLLEVIIKSTTETDDRWKKQLTSVTFNSIILEGTAPSVRAPNRKRFNMLIYGDSITEGVRTLGYQGIPLDTDRNDAVRDYSYHISQMLPVEIGIVAFGATGTTKGGSGGVSRLLV